VSMVLALAILGSIKKVDIAGAFIPPRYNIK
jgi:hypothetical protein